MHMIEVATAPCLCCGMGNVPRNDRTMPKFLDLERDVNWNDPAIICEDCGMKIGAMFDMLSTDERAELMVELRKRDQEIHELKAAIETKQHRIKQLSHRAKALEEAAVA